MECGNDSNWNFFISRIAKPWFSFSQWQLAA